MLELAVNSAVPETLFYDEIVNLDIKYTGARAAVTVQANAHGKSLDGTDVAIPLYEHEYSMEKETKSVEIHLKFVNQSLSDLSVEFSAVAVEPGPHVSSPPEAASEPLEFDIMDLGASTATKITETSSPSSPIAASTAVTHLGHEVAQTSISSKLVPCIDISMNYIRPGFQRDTALCQFDFTCFGTAVEITELEFRLQQGKVTLLVEPELPLRIEPSSIHAFAARIDTLVSASSTTANISGTYSCAGRPVKSQWSSRISLADSQGPAPKMPLPPPHSMPLSKRNSTLSTHSLHSASSQTAIYSGSVATAPSAPVLPVRTGLAGVYIYISGPNKVTLGSEFEWTISFVNKTNRTRKLGLFLHSKEPVVAQLSKHEERALVSDVHMLLKRLQAYRAAIGDVMGIIPLVPSVRVGQLGPFSSFDATVRFIAVEPGLHSVTGSTLHDFTSGEVYETGELLQVMVE